MARGELLEVEDEVTWIRDLYKMQWEHGRYKNLILVVQIMEYTKGRQFNSAHEIRQEYTSVGYASMVINNPDGTIKFGRYELELYRPPVNLTKKNPMDLLKSKVCITIDEPHFTMKPVS